MAKGSNFRLTQDQLLLDVKNCVARFFNAKANYTFLVPNFSFGFNTLLEGLPASSKFLLLQEDYPSVNYPVQSRGFECTYVDIDENLEENILAQIGLFKPGVFAFSMVQYISGIKMGLEFIKKIKNLYPNLMIVADGTQYCGTELFDFEQSGLDALISSSYKWILAGYGNGFVLLKGELAHKLYANARQKPLPDEPFLKGKGTISMFFEPGHQDTLVFGGLKQSLSYLGQTGQQFIQDKIKQRSQTAKAAFAERGLINQLIVDRHDHSSIFNLNIDNRVYQKLQDANIVTSARGKGIRVSFHFYNSENEIAHLLEVIDKNR